MRIVCFTERSHYEIENEDYLVEVGQNEYKYLFIKYE